jgi:hypothetical protein
MLEHFHGLQYTDEHQSLYKVCHNILNYLDVRIYFESLQGLDVQKDIDERKANPGQYFVLSFDFSRVNASLNLTEAHEMLVKFLNSSLEKFYRRYAAYLGSPKIDSKQPTANLWRCAESVQDAIEQDERLAGIEGIYVLVDEYDAFPNNYLELPQAVGGSKVAWEDTEVGRIFKSFWATIKSLSAEGVIRRIFITGISPLSLSCLGSAFNVARNLSFHQDLAGLCGLTSSDLEAALKEIGEDDKYLSEMTKYFNGYHFCKNKTVETVYNKETCLAYFQSIVDGGDPEIQDPANSEVSEQFLRRFAASALAIRDFEKALVCDEKGSFAPFKYDRFKSEFTLRDLVC